MPIMPPAAPDTFKSLVEGLAAECEILANQREYSLRREILELRKENDELRKRCGEAPAVEVSPALLAGSAKSAADAGNGNIPFRANSVADEGSFMAAPVISASRADQLAGELKSVEAAVEAEETKGKAMFSVGCDDFTANMKLPDNFWSSNPLREGLDHLGEEEKPEEVPVALEIHAGHSIILDPGGHTKLTWDIFGIPILAWDLITIPMQVFDIGDTVPMLVMGWVTLIYWTIDLPVTLMTGYFNDTDGSLVMDLRRIVRNYLHGFFFLDFAIIGADWAAIGIGAAGSDAPSFLSNLGVLRVLRISRFVRLMRLRKLKAKWQAIEDSIDNEWLLVCFTILAKCFTILGLNHYIGCAFFLIGGWDIPGYDSWLHAHRYPQIGGAGTISDAPWGYKYLVSLHWAITQFTPGSMHVQPQNIPERLFAIWCLIFGMVVVSGFIASVTQARMQLNKLMSKFERDLWLLRKYCRQNNVSRSLTTRMRRYVDLVLIPRFQTLKSKDVSLLSQLSLDLREELQTELAVAKLRCHPFFEEIEEQSKHTWNKNVVKKMCCLAVESQATAKGDILFSCGEVSKDMVMMMSGFIVYVPFAGSRDIEQLLPRTIVSEATLWTSWTHQGQLQVVQESVILLVHSDHFRKVIKQNGLCHAFAREYSKHFLTALNAAYVSEGLPPSDLQEHITKSIDVKKIAADTFAAYASGSNALTSA